MLDKVIEILERELPLRALAMQAKSKLEFLPVAKKYYDGIPVDEIYNSDCYALPFLKFFTPIEYEVWCFIRIAGLPFYPEYPVLNFFIDFADPVRKIGIECDGVGWHNPQKDAIRDAKLRELGWKIFRLSGDKILRRLSNDILNEVENEWEYLSEDGYYNGDYYDFRRNYLDENYNYSLKYASAIIEEIAHDYYYKDIIVL